ncbi:MAG: hypothetical protein HY540_02360 [Deltaproteobacteria bacterium]|nr:hypothetical protein [Deltaproteobacteria bacterium]
MIRLEELAKWTLPEYRERHAFVVKLRLAVFIAFWAFYLYFYHDVLAQTSAISLIISVCFLAGLIGFSKRMRHQLVLLSFVVELVADLVAMTTVIYLTGGPYSDYFTLYIYYVFAAGVFYNYILAAFIAVWAMLCYGAFLVLCVQGVIPPLILNYGDKLPLHPHTPFYHFLFASAFFAVTIYAVKIASFFSKKRECELEARNKELAALSRMSSTIRSTLDYRKVVDRILSGVLEGLGFTSVFMLHIERTDAEPKLLLYGLHDERRELPRELFENSVVQTIQERRIAYRRNFRDAMTGFEHLLEPSVAQKIEKALGDKRMIAVPIIVEKNALGAFIGFVDRDFVEEGTVQRLESFANQAGLTLEAALLIEKLRRANERLVEANRVKSDFLATMSHELRTPLTAIIGFSELLIEGVMGVMTEEQKESIQEILHNGNNLLGLINSLLDLSKADAGKMTLDVRPIRVHALLTRVHRLVSSLMQRKHLSVKLDIEDGPDLYADEQKIAQVCLNLLSNAVKFTPEGGNIHLRAFFEAEWKFPSSRGGWIFSVTDNGIGLPENNLDHLFEAFYQVDSSMTRSYGGTGLGLALARQFVELHHGHIWAERVPEGGARFVFALPHHDAI